MPTVFVNASPRSTQNLFTRDDLAQQRKFFADRAELRPTPLHRCSSLARHLGVRELLVKDETARFGLNAFKATGALFAITTLLERGDVKRGDVLVCASEGNHGRAVARAAREAGLAARVYVSQTVAPARVQAIASEGAETVSVDGSYDEAVRVMAREAETHGWVVISDTSWPGYSDIPRLIMLGYTRILDEIARDTACAGLSAPTTRPADAIFVPAGVGGLLAAVACWCDLEYGARRPKVIAVEPASAACVQASARAGAPTSVPGPFETTMGGLRCGEMSPDVFPVVASLVDGFVSIEDDFAFEAMRLLARPNPPDPPVRCGASGAAAAAGLLALRADPVLHSAGEALGINEGACVVALVTEGVTDPAVLELALARR